MTSRSQALFCALVCTLLSFCAQAQNNYAAVLQSARIALQNGNLPLAKAYFEQAAGLPAANQAEVSAGLAIVGLQLGDYAKAREGESKVLQLVHTPHERAEAHNLIGTAWLRESAEFPPGSLKLLNAESEFRQAIELDPAFYYPYFNLGNILVREGKGQEAEAAFREAVRAASQQDAISQHLPLLRQKAAPKFSVTDHAGRPLTLDSLKGRYTLVEFWATWCPPCIRALPVIRQLATYLPADQFQLVSIDEDKDKTQWEKFIADKKMTWTQVWDDKSNVYRQFDLAPTAELSLPRYVLIDPEGYELRTFSGTDPLDLMVGQVVRTVETAHQAERSN